jgi:hypothetical protein
MIPFLLTFWAMWLIYSIRIQLVFKARQRYIFSASSIDALNEMPAYGIQVLDITKWTYQQFFPKEST